MKKADEKFRDLQYSDPSYENNGVFIFPHYKIKDYQIRCIISEGEGWEHASVTIAKKRKFPSRCPTWEEMCWVKDQFWNDDETVVQFHPMKSEYVNCHPFVLHLWKQTNSIFQLPPSIMVGPK